MQLTLKNKEVAYEGSFYPGAKRPGDWQLSYTSDDLMDVIKALRRMR